MKLTKVILVVNDNPNYYKFANDVYDIWKNYIKIQPHLFIITDDKSKIELDFGNRIVQYINPIPDIPTAFQSQVIRLLLPCLYLDDFIIITDIDMIPIQKKFFKKYIKYISDDIFIKYFHTHQMCYNCAKGEIWRKIFKASSISDIQNIIKFWYTKFNGVRVTDQIVLKYYLEEYNGSKLILTSYLPNNTVIKRLSTYSEKNILKELNFNTLSEYLDFHLHHIFESNDNTTKYKDLVKFILTQNHNHK